MTRMALEPVDQAYEKRHRELREAIGELERASARISSWRGIAFLLLLAVVGYGIYRPMPIWGWGIAGGVGVAFAITLGLECRLRPPAPRTPQVRRSPGR